MSTHFPELVKLKISTERFLKVLRSLGIEYVMIGGIPAGFYGEPRFTQDLDFTADPIAIYKNYPQFYSFNSIYNVNNKTLLIHKSEVYTDAEVWYHTIQDLPMG